MTNRLKMADPSPWYSEGLRFQCTGCGQCCTGSPGYTWVNEDEIIAMADYLKISVDAFTQKYVRIVGERLALLEDQQNYDCVFLKDKKCSVYPVRPKQCQTYPWWANNLKTPADWNEAARFCEGINSQAPVVPFETIQENLS